MKPEPWTVGEVSKRTGLSVRTLHHYDDLGLVKPSMRSEGGYRLYTTDDLVRLQQVLSLKQLGFPLAEIRGLLDGSRLSAPEVFREHAERLRRQIAVLEEARAHLEAVAARLEGRQAVSAEDLFRILQETRWMNNVEKYYTPEQLETLRKRAEAYGEEGMRQAERDWQEVMDGMRAALEQGIEPDDPRVAPLARRWRELIEAFTGGDAGIERSLNNLYRQETGFAESMGMDARFSDYVSRALKAAGVCGSGPDADQNR